MYVLARVATGHVANSRHILSAMKRPAGSGPAARSSSELDAWLATLHAQAALASDAAVQVHDLEQQYGRADRALYRAHPQDWKLQPSVERRRVVICLSWQPRTPQAVPASMTQQRNDKARTQGLVRPPALTQRSVPCVSWAARALEIVEQAAKTFVEVHLHALREEFGQQLVCVCVCVRFGSHSTLVLNCRFLNSTFFHAQDLRSSVKLSGALF